MAMLSTTVDNFLLSYKDEAIQDRFFVFMMTTFDITRPSDQDEFTSLSLCLYQSSAGISINQAEHIYPNTLLE